MWIVWLNQHSYFTRKDFSLPSSHSNFILFPVIRTDTRNMGSIFPNILCVAFIIEPLHEETSSGFSARSDTNLAV